MTGLALPSCFVPPAGGVGALLDPGMSLLALTRLDLRGNHFTVSFAYGTRFRTGTGYPV